MLSLLLAAAAALSLVWTPHSPYEVDMASKLLPPGGKHWLGTDPYGRDVVSLLLVTFLVAVGSALYRGIDIENCGCFTVEGAGRQAGLWLLIGDAALLAVAIFLAAAPARATEARVESPEGALTAPLGHE